MIAAALSRSRPLPGTVAGGPFGRCGAALLLTALSGPAWNVVLVPLPGVSATVGRVLIVSTALLLALDWRRAPRPLPDVPRAVWLLLASLTLLLAWMVASALTWGCGCAGEIAGFSELLALVALAALAGTFEPRLRPVLVVAIVAGATLTALLTVAGVGGLSAGTQNPSQDHGRLAGPYGNPNVLAFAIGFAVPAAIVALGRWRGAARIAIAMALCLVSVVLLLTYSRGGLLAAAAGAGLVLVLSRRRGSRAQLLTIAAIAVAGAAAAAAYPTFAQQRRESTSTRLEAQLRALDRSGWDANAQGLIPAGAGRMSNPARGVLEVRADGPGRGVSRALAPAGPGDAYELRFEARALAGTQPLRYGLEDNLRGNDPSIATSTIGRSWRELGVRWRSPAESPNPRLYIWSPAAGAGFGLRAVRAIARRPGEAPVVTAFSAQLAGNRLADLKAAQARIDARDIRSRRVGVELALRAFRSEPVRGIGWGGFVRYSADNSEFSGLPTHDEYLRFLAELGIVGAGLLALAGLVVFRALWRRRRDAIGLALLGVLAVGAVGLVFVNGLTATAAAIPLGLAAALACARAGALGDVRMPEASALWRPDAGLAPRRAPDRAAVLARVRAWRRSWGDAARGSSGDGARRSSGDGARGPSGDGARRRAALALAAARAAAPSPRPLSPGRPAQVLAAGVEHLVEAAPPVAPAGRARGHGRAGAGRRRLTRHLARGALVLLALATVLLVGPGIHASGTFREVAPMDLGTGAPNAGVRTRGPVREDIDGYLVEPGGEAVAWVPLSLPDPGSGRTLLRVWAYGPQGVRTTAVLRAADGSERTLGRASNWVGKVFDVTEEARLGAVVLRVRGESSSRQPVLFLDRIAPIAASGTLEPSASSWSVGLLVLLVAAMLLELAGRLRRHWPLALVLAIAGAVLWGVVTRDGIDPVPGAGTWAAATAATWLGFDDGLLSGSWTSLSSLAVQVFHALTPLVGTAPASARTATLLATLAALAAVYALAFRAAGTPAALVATLLGVAALDLSGAVSSGSIVPVLVLAAALFGYAVHACLARATPGAIAALGAAAVVLSLADPAWLPGAVIAVLIVALACAPRGARLRVAGAGMLAVVVFALPHLTSTAGQHDGNPFADLQARATAARNIEFLGKGHGAPSPQQYAADPLGGRPVTLGGYLFADHSPTQLLGGTLAGGRDSIAAFGEAGRPAILGVLVLLLLPAGVAYVLLLKRLRLLVASAALVAAPTVFIASRTGADPVAAGAVLLPAMLACAAILVHAAGRLAQPVLAARLPGLPALAGRLRLPARLRRASTEPPAGGP